MDRIKFIEKIRDSFSNLKKDFSKKYSEKDVRVTIFSKIINVLNSAQLGSTFINQCLLNENWWIVTAKKSISKKDREIYAKEYDMFLKLGLFQFTYSSIESSLRLMLKSLDLQACSNSTAEFKNIYNCFFKKINLSNKENHIELLDLFRFIRNSIHNNGVYFHKSNQNVKLNYKNKEYSFIIGNKIDFATWDFTFELIKDIEIMLKEILGNSNITPISEIIDPFAE